MLSDGPTAETVYAQLYEAHAGAVLTYLTNKLRDPDTAQDVAQDAWIKAHRGLPAVLGRGDAASKAWLMRIATNAMTDHWRRVQSRPKTSDLDDALAPGTALPEQLLDRATPDHFSVIAEHQTETAREAALLLELLPRTERYLLWLYEWRGYSYEQMAVALGTTARTIKGRLYRAREAQRTIWEREHTYRARPAGGVEDRLWHFVVGGQDWARTHLDACWPWGGGVNGLGYPQIGVPSHRDPPRGTKTAPRRTPLAHRLLYALERGPLPPWAYLRPCTITARCVNPHHGAVCRLSHSQVAETGSIYRPCPAAADTPDDGGALGPDLRRRRLALGLQQQEVRLVAGVRDVGTMRRIERGALVHPVTVALVRRAMESLEARWTPVTTDRHAIRAKREAFGLSRDAFERLAGLGHGTLAQIEGGVWRTTRLRTLRHIQDALDRLEGERQEGAAA